MNKILVQAELQPEWTARAQTFVKKGWATDFYELLADALRKVVTDAVCSQEDDSEKVPETVETLTFSDQNLKQRLKITR